MQFRLNGKTQRWYPGKADTGNLMGTARTLDGCEGPQKINFGDLMEQGILSRDGWALIDESHRPWNAAMTKPPARRASAFRRHRPMKA